MVFIAGEYWVVVDRLRSSRPYRYDLRWHLTPEADGFTTISQSGDAVTIRAPDLALILPGTPTVTLEDGWVSPRYGIKDPAPVISVVTDGVADTDFFTLICPLPAHRRPPTMQIIHDGSRAPERTVLQVDGVGPDGRTTDLISLDPCEPHDRARARGADHSAAWIRTSVHGVMTHSSVARKRT